MGSEIFNTALGWKSITCRYPGAGHLFTDAELPDFDRDAAELAWKVAIGFLATL